MLNVELTNQSNLIPDILPKSDYDHSYTPI